jgi:hypothetical protein
MKRYIYIERETIYVTGIYKYINCDVNEKLTTNAYIRMQIYILLIIIIILLIKNESDVARSISKGKEPYKVS